MNTGPFHKLITAVEHALEQFRAAGEHSVQAAAELILAAEGKVVVTGVGKSGIIGHKTAATLASTGTPAVFLNAAEALHGDMGVVCRGDVVLMVSNSGETEELLRMLPSLRAIGVRTIGLLGKPESTLAGHLDLVIPVETEEEGETLNLAPMCSTALSLVAGDTLAATLLAARGFGKEEFAVLHPGGFLGRAPVAVGGRCHEVADRGGGPGPRGRASRRSSRPSRDFLSGWSVFWDAEDVILGVITDGRCASCGDGQTI